jgi:hypothetical protein
MKKKVTIKKTFSEWLYMLRPKNYTGFIVKHDLKNQTIIFKWEGK